MKQLTLFDLAAILPAPPPPIHDPAWDKDDTVDSPESPSSQENFSPYVLERDTQDAVPEHKTPCLQPHTEIPEHIELEFLQWIETYSPSKRKANSYYRYCFKQGRKIHHIHISGGNTRSHLAQSRKSKVESAIADGETPTGIQNLIRSWKS